MVYYRHRRNNSTSALSFTSSTVSTSGGSFMSNDDPNGSSSFMTSMKNILKSVYRCDSAAVVDGGDSSCGSIANQALYQGVEVILRKTTCNYGNDIGKNLKSSVASKPFFEYKCFCDDDDFITEDAYPSCMNGGSGDDTRITKSGHVRGDSSCTTSSGESRNERNPAGCDDEDVRNERTGIFVSPNTPQNRHTALTTHTKKFYSQINSPASREVNRLYDMPTPSYSSTFVDKVPAHINTTPEIQVSRITS
mmetsp:Transcript_16112/g.44594  ORF Transcript_16112/g.44594 Transcript_16112/m.44594 type:complete len:250 (+) Transcript_16112:108-857(+)